MGLTTEKSGSSRYRSKSVQNTEKNLKRPERRVRIRHVTAMQDVVSSYTSGKHACSKTDVKHKILLLSLQTFQVAEIQSISHLCTVVRTAVLATVASMGHPKAIIPSRTTILLTEVDVIKRAFIEKKSHHKKTDNLFCEYPRYVFSKPYRPTKHLEVF